MPNPKRLGTRRLAAVDLFCGAGGLTCGLLASGVPVVAGLDTDESCRFPFEHNNAGAKFINFDLAAAQPKDISKLYPDNGVRILVGCAPCQPFSTYSRTQKRSAYTRKWQLLDSFSRIVVGVMPHVVSMENVPQLVRHKAFGRFVETLKKAGYHVAEPVIAFGPDYGLPQERKRLILFASLLGDITLIPPTHTEAHYRTLESAIGHLEPLEAGGASAKDRLHKSCTLSKQNLQRIKASSPGGTWRDWPSKLVAKCHQKDSGGTYPSVYGRMEWGKPAPTITTQFYGFGNGRFGHPDQHRAISLREGAILQDFPRDYQFVEPRKKVHFRSVGRMIGNAVPVSLGAAVGRTIIGHLNSKS